MVFFILNTEKVQDAKFAMWKSRLEAKLGLPVVKEEMSGYNTQISFPKGNASDVDAEVRFREALNALNIPFSESPISVVKTGL